MWTAVVAEIPSVLPHATHLCNPPVQAPISHIKEPRASMFSSSSAPRLVAYVCPGSRHGKHEVHVSHKAKYKEVIPPTVLFLDPAEVEALEGSLVQEESDWRLPQGSLLEASIQQLLQ